jgi:hypothetical protein
MAFSIISPKQPREGSGWRRLAGTLPPSVTLGFEAYAWCHKARGLRVISAVEVAKDADGIDRGPEYHVSISREGRRCSSADARTVLADFDMDGAEEDNHVPYGVARNFWRPVADRFVGLECACKESESAVIEDKGDYVWRPAPQEGQ